MHLDMLSKMYEQWDAEELEMDGKDEDFITSLAERIQASEDPTNFPLSAAQEEWIEDCWERYMEDQHD